MYSMKNYAGVLLDADNTLFDYDRAETEALEETLADVAPATPRMQAMEAYRAINAGYWKRFEAGGIDAEGLRIGRWVDLFRTLGLPGDPALAAADYTARVPLPRWRRWRGGRGSALSPTAFPWSSAAGLPRPASRDTSPPS